MHIIAIANQKGGCGKTTTAINLASALGQQQQRVLLLDMDPQGHASLGLGQSTTELNGLYEVFQHEVSLIDVVISDVCKGVDLIPATLSLAAFQQVYSDKPERERQLLNHLDILGDYYDYVLIDCPPALGLLAINALRAADEVLVPVDTSLYALEGIERLNDIITLLATKYGLDIPVKVLPTLFDGRTRLAQLLLNELRTLKGCGLCAARIRNTVKIREAAYYGKSVLDYAPRCSASNDYQQLAHEYIEATTAATTPLPIAPPITETTEVTRPATGYNYHEHSRHERQQVVLNYRTLACDRLQIAGDFNDWLPDNNVETRIEGNAITKVLTIEPGAYEYRVIIDGIWQQDPTNPNEVPNSLGGTNSVLRV